MTQETKLRYARALAVEGFEERHQQLLGNARVLIIGCGALGSQVALYLAGSGVGTLGLVDYDNIEVSNLQRQIVYRTSLVGKPKAETLAKSVTDLNPTVSTSVYRRFVRNSEEVARLAVEGKYNLIIEATDSAYSKRIVTEGARKADIPCIFGGVDGWSGQVFSIMPGDNSISYEDIFGLPTNVCPGITPCSTNGVIGPVPGIVSAVQATEAIKILTGLGQTLSNRLLQINGLTMTFTTLRLS